MQSERRTITLPANLRHVPILANPNAGSGPSRRIVEELVVSLRSRGLYPKICWERDELDSMLAPPIHSEIRCVVAAGGDGTLLEVVNRAPGIPAAVLPLGNENLVARHCGLSRSGRQLAAVIAAGHVRQLDLARADNRLFCLMASAGLDADVVHRVHRRRRGHIHRLTYLIPFIQAMGAYLFPLVDVEIVDSSEKLRGASVFVFNLPEYAMGLPLVSDGNAEDGLLDVCVFEKPGAVNLLGYLGMVWLRSHRERPGFVHRRVRQVRLSSPGLAPVQMDGDPAGSLPVTIEVAPGALPLLVPNRG